MISLAKCFQITSKGIVLFILLFSFNELFAAEGGPCKDYGECDKFQYSLNDIESLQRGASTYINYCYGCHSLKYSRWGRVAKDLQIPEEIFFQKLVGLKFYYFYLLFFSIFHDLFQMLLL